ncbi:YwmB family TATA-box binding protein [Paenibacillus kobensis]|uniref:YwmB family TATA-box binding protein n=1 Tax=Paenibacillus kobensis TaxID=59841 RepID=UPI000FD85788|nr:YwmB family TATA-box binding protein [Paenibacillus kobensis]
MKRQSAARKPSQSLIPVLIAAAVLVAGAIFATNLRTDKPEGSAASDLSFIWKLSSQLVPQGAADDRSWLVRFDAEEMRDGDVLRAAGLLGLHRSEGESTGDQETEPDNAQSKPEQGQEPEQRLAYEGELVLKRAAQEGGAHSKVPSVQADSVTVPVAMYRSGGASDAVVILQPSAPLAADELEDAARLVEEALQRVGGKYSCSFRVTGSATIQDIHDTSAMTRLMSGVIEEADAKLVERYEDDEGASISETYMSPHIHASIETKGKRANLQLSVHRDSESDAADWVIGVPVITGDYTLAK